MGFILLLFLIAIPAVEILLFIEVGGEIGALPTVLLTVFTAGAGLLIVRAQGIELVSRAQQSMERGEAPLKEVMDGLVLLVAGACLLIPGFFTDVIGGLLLIPLVREAIGVVLLARVLVARTRTYPPGGAGAGTAGSQGSARRGPHGEAVIEGDYQDVTPNEPDHRLDGGEGENERDHDSDTGGDDRERGRS